MTACFLCIFVCFVCLEFIIRRFERSKQPLHSIASLDYAWNLRKKGNVDWVSCLTLMWFSFLVPGVHVRRSNWFFGQGSLPWSGKATEHHRTNAAPLGSDDALPRRRKFVRFRNRFIAIRWYQVWLQLLIQSLLFGNQSWESIGAWELQEEFNKFCAASYS